MDWKKALAMATAVFTLLGAAGGAIWALDEKYVSNEKLQMVTESVDLRFDMYRQEQLSDQIFKYKLYMKENPNDDSTKKDLIELEQKKEQLDKHIEEKLQKLQLLNS